MKATYSQPQYGNDITRIDTQQFQQLGPSTASLNTSKVTETNHGVVYQTPAQIVSQRVLGQPTITPSTYVAPQLSQIQQVDHGPIIHELHHVQRNVNVVNVEEIEGAWRQRVNRLERQMLELELLVRKAQFPQQLETKQVVVQDNAKIKALQDEIADLQAQQQDYNAECDNLVKQLNELQYQLENSVIDQSEIKKNEDEIAKWKKKFSELNGEHHQKASDLMLAQAEIESIRKRKVTEVVTTQKSQINRSTGKRDSMIRNSGYRS